MSSNRQTSVPQRARGLRSWPWPLPVLVTLLLTVLPAADRAARAQGIVVKMATFLPDGSRGHVVLKEMAEAWKAASSGRVTVRLYPGGVAGDDPDVVRKMRAGTLNAAMLTSVGLGEVDRSVHALGLPLAYESYDEVYGVLERMRPRLETGLSAKGFVVLNWVDGGWVRIFADKPVATPDDLRGQKLFSWAQDKESIELWKSAGFDPIPLPAHELGPALASGRVTAVGMPPPVAVATQYYTKVLHMTDLPFQLLLGATVMSRATWDEIPADLRPLIGRAAAEAGARLREDMRQSGDRDILEMKKRGLQVVPVDGKAREEWRRTVQGLFPRIRGTLVPAEAFDEALRLRDELRRRPGER